MARACHLAWPIRSRIGVIRCSQSFEYQSCGASEKFTEFQLMMIEADSVLRPGIEAMPGLINYYAGADEANSSLRTSASGKRWIMPSRWTLSNQCLIWQKPLHKKD